MKPYVPKAARKRRGGFRVHELTAEAQELWLALTRRTWSTLVLLPAHEEGSALNLAYELVEIAKALHGKPPELLCTEGMDTRAATGWLFEALAGRVLHSNAAPGDRLATVSRFERLVVLEPVVSNPLGIAIAHAADAVLLVVEKGVSDLEAARWTLGAIGRDRFIGCVFISPPGRP